MQDDAPRQTASQFHAQPVPNSPYEIPCQHWELDEEGQPTGRIHYETVEKPPSSS